MRAIKIIKEDRIEYRNINGELHREDGPAIEWNNGAKKWFLNGKLHRVNGPAIEHINGILSWYHNGELHRTDGPAVIWPDGEGEFWLNGEELTEEEFNLKSV